ncbi:hypothetical protein EBF04_16400 [Streptomyces sp. I6]|nr:hypothetical protein EBF04_16400 [Streptomyces sp. I6]
MWAAMAACAMCAVFAVVLALGQAVVARHRAGAAADLAALAAADRALEGAGQACAQAARVAGAQGAVVVRCAVAGEIADVTAGAARGPYRPEVRSRAGPPAPSSSPVPPAPPVTTVPPVSSHPPDPLGPPALSPEASRAGRRPGPRGRTALGSGPGPPRSGARVIARGSPAPPGVPAQPGFPIPAPRGSLVRTVQGFPATGPVGLPDPPDGPSPARSSPCPRPG